MSLAGQVGLVTGGGRGIGRAIAEALVADGMAVAVAARSREQIAETAEAIARVGGRALPVVVDVSDTASVTATVAEVERTLGPIDLLVNNAGVSGPTGPIWEIDPGEWMPVLRVNLLGAVTCSHVVLKTMVERGHGRVINVSSDAAVRAYPFSSAYSVSKAALVRLTDSLAADVASYGIQVFAMSPGIVRTSMTEDGWQHMETGRLPSYSRRIPNFPAQSGLTPEDWVSSDLSGQLAVFLASGAGDALAGRFLHVLDDVGELVARADEVRRDDLYTLRLRRLTTDVVVPERRW